MMKDKLYYQDAYIQSFSANIIKQEQNEQGNWYIIMDRTAFYPTGGGQPHDIGTVDGIKVTSVEEIDGEIRHFLEKPLDDTDKKVVCVLDWQRRFDYMQQHSGQHILSAAFDNLFHYKTVGFHLGNEVVTIDLESESLSEQEVIEAEKLANHIILENRPIKTKWVTEAELAEYPLRKQTKVKENIRLVIIPDFDYNGCGGTHPKTTGEVRAIKILDWERQKKKKIRVQFVCGERVLTQFQLKQKVLLELKQLLSAPESEMADAVTQILQSGKELERALKQAKESLLEYEARELQRESRTTVNGFKAIGRVYRHRTIQELQKLARLCNAEDPKTCVVIVAENGNKLQLVAARGTNGTKSMKDLLGVVLPLINGKGGGNATFAQGGGDATMSGERLLEIALKNIAAS